MDKTLDTGPWHAGEIAMQDTIGAVERMRDIGRRVVRDHMPDQHREFYATLSYIILGSVGRDGTPFASIITGEPGFVTTPDARTVLLKHDLPLNGSAASGLTVGQSVGLLGIELHTRRRNRVNGRITSVSGRILTVAVEHSFGNCPKYIQLRGTASPAARRDFNPGRHTCSTTLDDGQRAVIRDADTLFVATYADIEDEAGNQHRQVDVSHRGGKPGFVRVDDDDTLAIPDFVGNNFFNTLGNIAVNPRAGLLFINFEEGSTLQVEGSAEIVTTGSAVEAYRGAERIWRVRPRNILQSIGRAIPLDFNTHPDGLSPFLLETGSWAEAKDRSPPNGKAWPTLRVERVEDVTANVRSFYLASADGTPLPRHVAGQHVSVRLPATPERGTLVKTYTLSSRPDDLHYRISVKKQGAGSTAMHEVLTVGTPVDVSPPAGGFVLPEETGGELIFLAGGIGITPVLSMLYDLEARYLAGKPVGRTRVIYAVRHAGDFALLPELQAICQRLEGLIQLTRLVSRPEDGDAEPCHDATGRFRGTLLEGCDFNEQTHAFLCGPDGFMRSATEILLSLGLPPERIHQETFEASTIAAGFRVMNHNPGKPATAASVRLSRSGIEATWHPGRGTLLEFIEALGIQPDFSCRSGSCGTCRTRLTAGVVDGPTTAPQEDGTTDVLICCAYPAGGAALVLDL